MKKVLLCVVVALSFAFEAFAASQFPITGSVSSEEGSAVAYATVVALQGGEQVAGTTTNDKGEFELRLVNGAYELWVEFLGYETVKLNVEVAGEMKLEPITMRVSSVSIESVAVTAQIIKREADRFVVDVSNMPSALGKNGVELLSVAPAVFVSGNKISINGKSGTTVFVNDRELKYQEEQLMAYLRSLKSEEIRSIEVIPIAGADYDANSSGGIIKITLKRQREDGIVGNVSLQMNQSKHIQNYDPSVSLNYHSGKWNVNASGWYSFRDQDYTTEEATSYVADNKIMTSNTKNESTTHWSGANLGAIYDINKNHSIGAEVNYYGGNGSAPIDSETTLVTGNEAVNSISDFDMFSRNLGVSATLNYIAKLDDKGSQLKILADYNYGGSSSNNKYETEKNYVVDNNPLYAVDSLCRDKSTTDFHVTTVNVGYRKVFSHKLNLNSGLKYTNNIMRYWALYEYQDAAEQWQKRENYSYDERYTEHIGAAFLTARARLGRWDLVAGLRGEYTYASGSDKKISQNYFSLFPNANVSYALTEDESYSMVLQYARKTRRPTFWALNPMRTQLSEYSYQVGNPYLSPQFVNDISMTFVLKYKYTISLGAMLYKDHIQQIMKLDADNPDNVCFIYDNLHSTQNYYASISLPFQLTDWWTLNLNATVTYNGIRIDNDSPQEFRFMADGNAQTTFILPKEFYIDLTYSGMTNQYIANMEIKSNHRLNFAIKKQLLKNQLLLSAGVNNLIPVKDVIVAKSANTTRTLRSYYPWDKPMFTFSAMWSFNKGKEFRQKNIERGIDASRLAQ